MGINLTLKVMKRLINIAFILMLSVNAFAQIPPSSEYSVRKMETYGYASANLNPNVIYTSFVIKEFKDNNKVVTIKETEAAIRKAVKKIGCKSGDLTIGNIYGYISYNGSNNEEGVFEHRRLYLLKLSSVDCVDMFLDIVDPRSLESFNIDDMENDNIDSTIQELQLKAFSKAREKATVLLASYGEKCGKVLQIEEVNRNIIFPDLSGKGSKIQSLSMQIGNSNTSTESRSRTIKVEYQVKMTFEIK